MESIIRKIFTPAYVIVVGLIIVFTLILQGSTPVILSTDKGEGDGYEVINGTIKNISDASDDEEQILLVKASSGEEKGKMINVSYVSANNYNTYNEGNDIQIIKTKELTGKRFSYAVFDYDHLGGLLLILLIFIASAVVIARKKGVTAILSITVSLLFFYFLFLKMIIAGYSPLLACMFFVLIVTFITIPLIHGFNRKSLSAILAILIGYVFSILISFLFAGLVQLGRAPDEDFRILSINYPLIDLSSLLIASLFIGAIGALIDTAISISSAIFEALKEHAKYTFIEVYKIGMEIGKDVLGSMINTLLFAYLASSLPFFIIIALSKGGSLTELINFDFIAFELTKTFIGAVSLVFLIPITASISAYYLIKSKKNI